MTREELQEFKTILETEQAGIYQTLVQNRRNIGIETSADILEGIRTANPS